MLRAEARKEQPPGGLVSDTSKIKSVLTQGNVTASPLSTVCGLSVSETNALFHRACEVFMKQKDERSFEAVYQVKHQSNNSRRACMMTEIMLKIKMAGMKVSIGIGNFVECVVFVIRNFVVFFDFLFAKPH